MTRYLVRWACSGLLFVAISTAAAAAAPEAQVRSVRGSFGDIKERVVMALENRGLVVNYTARIGAMLDRTGHDLGRAQPVYTEAEAIEFCSARLSRETMEADPHNIVFCPYAIAIYTLPQAPGTVYVSFRAPGRPGADRSAQSLRAVEKLLAEVVAEALQ